MIYNQENDSPQRRDQEAMQVEAVHTNMAEHMKQPTADDRADNTEQDIQHNTFAPMVYDMAGDKSCNQSQ